MSIEDLLKSLELPKKYYDSNFDISEKYREETEIFLNALEMVDGNEFDDGIKQAIIKEKFKELIPLAEKSVNKIIDVFTYYNQADLKCAQEEFDALMESLSSVMFIVTIDDRCIVEASKRAVKTQFRITGGRKFYRVRGVKGKQNDIESNPDELFHIPLTKKALTNNERFSLAGFPSLYLSSMLPLAWQESGYPQRYYYSEYQYLKMYSDNRTIEDELKFVALYSPLEIKNWGMATKFNDFDLWIHVVYRILMMYPLVLACSFVNHSGKGAYKQEYIIPQMLMQWVLRNNQKIQGISYFTCVDTSMMSSGYCAYNVVIPALKPYDDEKYSQKLRDEFSWTKPQYYEVSLFDSEYNKTDRKKIYDFINKIRNLCKMGLPNLMQKYLGDIERMCICLYQLMLTGNNSDMQMVIHTLNLIDTCHQFVKSQSIDTIIENSTNDNYFLIAEDYEHVCQKLKEISLELLVEDRKANNVGAIIDKYKNTMWNFFCHESYIYIGYREGDKILEIEKWCHDNHLLCIKHIISEADAKLFDKTVGEIITPVVQRRNSVSIYDADISESIDYIKEGFNPVIHGKEILK